MTEHTGEVIGRDQGLRKLTDHVAEGLSGKCAKGQVDPYVDNLTAEQPSMKSHQLGGLGHCPGERQISTD